jgi:hypothetical protein
LATKNLAAQSGDTVNCRIPPLRLQSSVFWVEKSGVGQGLTASAYHKLSDLRPIRYIFKGPNGLKIEIKFSFLSENKIKLNMTFRQI